MVGSSSVLVGGGVLGPGLFLFEAKEGAEFTLQGTNISHLRKGKSSSNMPYQGDMLVPWRVEFRVLVEFWLSVSKICIKFESESL